MVALALSTAALAYESTTTKKTEQVNLTDVKEQKLEKKKPEKATTRFTRNEAFLIATETRLLQEIQKAINYLSKQSARMPKGSPTRLEMLDRLVNLRLESAVYYANQEIRKYDTAYDAWENGGKKGVEPRLDESSSRGEWQILATEAQKLLDEYPRSKNADTTMFNMGLAFNFLKRDKDAARIFSQLIAKYPNSQKAGDAYFALGDFYFDRADFRNAMNNYKNALKFRQAKSYSFSLFKLAWCNYNLNNYPQALAYWKQTVVEAARSGKKGLALREEALRDMVYGFAELKQVEPAIAYYRRNGGEKYIGRFLVLLSEQFSDQGQYNEAITVLKRFQQVAPYDEQGPETQKEIIALNYELSRIPVVWTELARFPRLYGAGSKWGDRFQQSDKKTFLEVQQLIKDQILYYSKLTHKNAQKDDNRKLYDEALKGYTLFLASYPKAREVAEVKFNMADIRYFTKDFREAGKLYLDIATLGKDKAVVYDPKTAKATNIHKQSADFMLDAYFREFEPELKVMLKKEPDFAKAPAPITENGKNFIRACGFYVKWYPAEKKNVKTCDVFITEIYYRSNDKKNAMRYLWVLAKKYPDSKEGTEAVSELIPLYGKDQKALEKAIAELRKIPAYQKGEIGKKLQNLEYGVAVDVAKSDPDACSRAKKYEELYKKNPSSKDSVALINNAAVDYVKCGKISEGIAAYGVVIKRFPTSAAHKDALLEVAKLQENRLELGQAAAYFLEFAKRYPKEKEALGALANACEIQAALASDAAVGTCLQFAGADQQSGKVIFQRMLRAAFSANDDQRLLALTKIYTGRFRLSAAERIVALSMIANARTSASAQAGQEILNVFRQAGGNVEGEALRAVGKLAFASVNGEMGRYASLRLKGGTPEAFQASLGQKANAFQKLRATYEQVIKTGDAFWGVAALYQIGHAAELLANDLEHPPEITGAKYDDVVKQLAPDAKQARNEATTWYRKALDAVEKYLVYNEWAAKALSGLARNSGKNISFDDLVVRPDFLGSEVPETVGEAVR
jgi:TolA-binding protein